MPKLLALQSKMGGQSIPSMIARPRVAPKAGPAPVQPPKSQAVGSNAQTQAYQKAMSSAMRKTKTYGTPMAPVDSTRKDVMR